MCIILKTLNTRIVVIYANLVKYDILVFVNCQEGPISIVKVPRPKTVRIVECLNRQDLIGKIDTSCLIRWCIWIKLKVNNLPIFIDKHPILSIFIQIKCHKVRIIIELNFPNFIEIYSSASSFSLYFYFIDIEVSCRRITYCISIWTSYLLWKRPLVNSCKWFLSNYNSIFIEFCANHRLSKSHYMLILTRENCMLICLSDITGSLDI